MNTLLRFLVIGLLLGAPCLFAEEPATRSEVERQLVDELAAGRDVDALVAQLGKLEPSAARPVPRSLSRVAADLDAALEGMERVMAAKAADPDSLVRAYDALRAADGNVRAGFQETRERLEELGAGDQFFQRLDDAEASYLDDASALFDPLEGPLKALRVVEKKTAGESAAELGAAKTALEAFQADLEGRRTRPAPPILGSGLPYRRLGLAPRTPKTEPAVTPSYLDPAAAPSTGEDLAATSEAPLDDEILALAESLDHDFVKIFEFVRNEIDTELYAGSMKGAAGTLRDRAGNDVDQASLLIALARASRLPARYVHGVVELSTDELAADLGLADPGRVPDALARAGLAFNPVIRGGRVAAVRVEHTWVSVYVPYSNYRGAVVDFSGRVWLPLAPAIKSQQRTSASGVLSELDDAIEGRLLDRIITRHLSVPQAVDPLADLRGEVESYLLRTAPDATWEDQLATRTVVDERLGYLPSSLPMPVVAVTGESPELAPEYRVSVRFVVREELDETSPVILDGSVPLADLAARRVTFSYIPATVEDDRIVNGSGGLTGVPVYLVRIRPQLKIDGHRELLGEASEMGVAQLLEIEIQGPFGSERMTQTLISGSYHALGFSVGALPQIEPVDDPSDSEYLAARLLSGIALGYHEQWSTAETELAGLLDIELSRPLPAVSLVTDAVVVDHLFDLPFQMRWTGVTLDAAFRAVEPVADDEAVAGDWMRFSALQGSALEHQAFENEFLVESISADKGLALAREAGLTVLELSDPADPQLAGLAHPLAIREDVERWLRLGMTVEVPAEPITHHAWTGSTWRVEDPASGAAGYFISGGLAGGATAEAPDSWAQATADALGDPYLPEPNPDPLAGFFIHKILHTDGQVGQVGEVLALPLTVVVQDADRRPVQGAAVTFFAGTSGGALVDESGNEVSSLTATTDASGEASARFRLGRYTRVRPFYIYRNAEDDYLTQALDHEINAVVTTFFGEVYLDEPFQPLAYPGDPDRMKNLRSDSDDTVSLQPDTGIVLRIGVVDQYDNPISNETIEVHVLEPEFDSTCKNRYNPENGRNARVYLPGTCSPLDVGCGSDSVVLSTSIFGASAGVTLGNDIASTFRFEVRHASLEPLTLTHSFFYYPIDNECLPSLEPFLVPKSVESYQGEILNATRTLSTYPEPIEVELYQWVPDVSPYQHCTLDVIPGGYEQCIADGYFEWVRRWASTGKLYRTRGDVVFSTDGGASVTPAEATATGYSTYLTTGIDPAHHKVYAEASNVVMETRYVDPDSGAISEGQNAFGEISKRQAGAVWAVETAIGSITPSLPSLNDAGRLADDVGVGFRIDPTNYVPRTVELDVLDNGVRVAGWPTSVENGIGQFILPKGLDLDYQHFYQLQIVLNRGSDSEILSDLIDLPLAQRILSRADQVISVSQDVDIVNDRVCLDPSVFEFTLNHDAHITLSFHRIDHLDTDGSPVLLPDEIKLIDDEIYAEGDHSFPISTATLPQGEYQFQLLATSVLDPLNVEVRSGMAYSSYRVHDKLPVGQSLIKGVNLWSGQLTIQREDISVPGRGRPLDLRRTYSIGSYNNEGSPFGIGWGHSYQSRVILNPCGEAVVVGGEGSGMRFIAGEGGVLRPQRGYHGTLINNEDYSFDFFTLTGNRYHYLKGLDSEWLLDSITDPSGNVTRLGYIPSDDGPLLSTVTDAGGRTLTFRYINAVFALWEGKVIHRVDGPDGLSVSYEYDRLGNLIHARRENKADGTPSRDEEYSYEFQPIGLDEVTPALVTTKNLINGATTRYRYSYGEIPFRPGVTMPAYFVSELEEPKGGITSFQYSLAAGELEAAQTTVTDALDHVTTYSFNRFGNAVRIVDPENNVTLMEWGLDDALVTSRTDANGSRTDFTYDEHGNLLTETTTVTDREGQETVLTKTSTYYPPETFDPPHIKNNLRTSTDRNGHTTYYEYDLKGRLLEKRISARPVLGGADQVVKITQTYTAQGDLRSITDPRGNTTLFEYDAYGNLQVAVDPLGNETRQTWDVRSRLVEQVDALGRSTFLFYDTLDRVVRRQLPDGSLVQVLFDDINNRRTEIDAEERATTTTFDLEGRPVLLENAGGGTKILEYDLTGNKTLESSWFDAETPRTDTAFVFDRANRLTVRNEPLGRTVTFVYDGVGNVLRETLSDRDPLSDFEPRVTESSYDELNRLVEQRRQLDDQWSVVRFAYDGEGNKVLEIDPLGRERTFRYDALGRLVETVEPSWDENHPVPDPGTIVVGPTPRITHRVYDAASNLVKTILYNRPVDQVREIEYDALNRVILARDALGYESTREYDAVGNLITEIDPLLNTVQHVYDLRDRLERTLVKLDRVTDPARDLETRYVYDKVGNRTEEHWPNGNVVIHTYDALNRLVGTTDTLGAVTTAGYDARGNRIRSTDANGKVAVTTFDDLNRVTRQVLPENRIVSLTYDVAGNKLSGTNARGYTTTFAYDRLDRLVATTDPAPFSYTTSFTYDLAGNKLTGTDRRGNTSSFEYDDLNRLVRRIDPPLSETAAPYSIEYTYDAADNRIGELDRRGILTKLAYDAENRRTKTTRAGLVLEETEYDADGNVLLVTDANGNITGFEYDERNLVIAENRPLAAISRHTYDDIGDRVSTRDPEGKITRWSYDLRRRLESETREISSTILSTTTYGYDGNGNRTSMTRPEGGEWEYVFDGANRLVSVTNPELAVTGYRYDKNGNLRFQTDANQNVTEFTYDELDRRTSLIYPDGAFESSVYDANGNVIEHRDAKDQLFSYEYDVLNRLTFPTYPPDPGSQDDLQEISNVYDENNNLLEVQETFEILGTVTTTRTYDAFDRMESVTDRWSNRIRYTYDANGNRTQLIDPSGSVTQYTFDALNRLTDVTVPGAGTTEYQYLRNSRLKAIAYPSGTTAAYTFDGANRLKTIDNRHNGALVSRFEYDYDLDHNRIQQIEEHSGQLPETTTYDYDLADRLLEVVYPEKTTTYTYDDVGNRWTEVEVDPAGTTITDKTFTYNLRNQLTELTNNLDGTQSVVYGYDANGNQTSRATGAGELTDFLFDVRDQIAQVTKDGTPLGTYGYDAQGLRIMKTTSEGLARYVYDDQSVLQRINDDGTTKYEYGPDRLLSVSDPVEGRAFYLHDALGSVVDLMTPAGSVLGRYKYDAWGNLRESLDTAANPFGFTGHEHDSETGLIYAKARFYDPEIGRFLSHDPVEGDPGVPPSLHKYLYVFDNPTSYVDPDGQFILAAILIGVIVAEAHVIYQEIAEGKNLKTADKVDAALTGAATTGIIISGGTVGVAGTATGVGIGAAFSVGEQTLVEKKELSNLDYERVYQSGGIVAGLGGIGSAGLGSQQALVRGGTKVAGMTLGLTVANEGAETIGEGIGEDDPEKVIFGSAEAALGLYTTFALRPRTPKAETVVESSTEPGATLVAEPSAEPTGPLKNRSGNLDSAAQAARTQSYYAEELPARPAAPDSASPETFGPLLPRSPLGRDISEGFPDPDPIVYKNDLRPDTPVVDHIRARALRGHPTDPNNLHVRTWSENSRKGWHEGNYLRERARLVEEGLTPEQAEWVLEDYLRWIETDIHASPVEPVKLDKLLSP